MQGCTDLKALALRNSSLEPYIVLVKEDEAYLIIDKQVVDKVCVPDIPSVLMSAFLCLTSVSYPKGCNNFYSMLEILILKFSPERGSPSVKYLLTKLRS